MYRTAIVEDLPQINAFLADTIQDTTNFLQQVAGLDNIYLAYEENAIVAVLIVVPVSLQTMQGGYFYHAFTVESCRKQGIMTALVEYAKTHQKQKGAEFAIVATATQQEQSFWQKQGFSPYFRRRRLLRTIKKNLWAQAQFDTVSAPKLGQLRQKYAQDGIALSQPGLVTDLVGLYSQGATALEIEKGYGIFFEDTTREILQFVELFAQSDFDAQILLEAARERTGLEKAEIILPENSEVCLGEGQTEVCGMAIFWKGNLPLRSGYLPLLLQKKESYTKWYATKTF